MSKREFCFWIIPAGETSQVKKIRLSVWKLATILTIASACIASLMFVAADYVRIHGLNLKNYALWRSTASQRNSLMGEKDDLRAKLNSFVAANSARDLINEELENKLDELSSFLNEAKAAPALSDFSSKNEIRKSTKMEELEKAIGGLERGCGASGCKLLEQDLIVDQSANAQISAARATYNPSSLFGDEKEKDQLAMLTESLRILRAIPLLLPVQGDLTSGFGFRWSPFENGVAKHEGLDFAAPEGTAVGSAGDGVVSEVKRNATYGLMIDIKHTNRITTRYAHLSSSLVTVGEKLLRGDLIGQVGSTGHSTGPHLHYEVILDGEQVNPQTYLSLSEKLTQLMKN